MRLLLLLLTVISTAYAVDFMTEEAIVSEVIDGDTIAVELDNGNIKNIRLIDVSAPEDPSIGGTLVKDPIGGPAAKEHLEELIGEEYIILEIYPDDKNVDRIPAFVYLPVNEEPGKKLLVNLRMVEDGYAIADSENATDPKYNEVFIKAEENAKTDGRGLWGTDKVYLTATGEVYHVTGCQNLNKSDKPKEISRLEALREGIEPCEICQGK